MKMKAEWNYKNVNGRDGKKGSGGSMSVVFSIRHSECPTSNC
jgi:hypothetical protein